MKRLTPRQELFVAEYLVDFNATQAAARAGYSKKTAGKIGHELLKKPEIQTAIRSRLDELTAEIEITQEKVLREYARVAFFDPRKLLNSDGTPKPVDELDDNTAAALAGLDVEVVGNEESGLATIRKYKIANKLGGLDSLSKYLGLFEKHNDQKKPIVFDVKFNRDE
jgi:phage terminase small subunit